jgi:hypothetical protein
MENNHFIIFFPPKLVIDLEKSLTFPFSKFLSLIYGFSSVDCGITAINLEIERMFEGFEFSIKVALWNMM